MLNPLKVFGAGLSTWGEGITKHWKKILLGILIIPILFAIFCALIVLLTFGMFKLLLFLVAIPGLNDFCNKYPRGIACGIMGGMIIYVTLFSLYQNGKKKLVGNI